MMLRKCLKLSEPLRRSKGYSQRLLSHQSSQVEKNEGTSELLGKKSITSDELSKELKTLVPTRILLVLENNSDKIDGSHIVTALRSFSKLYRRNMSVANKSIEKSNQWENQRFHDQFCSLIVSNADKITGTHYVQILDLLTRLNVSQDSEIIQTILQRISQTLNNLPFTDYSLLSGLIRKLPQSKLTDNIQSALVRKFIVKLSIEMEDNNIEHLEQALSFASQNLHDLKLLEILINKLLNYKKDIPLKTSIMILESLCSMNHYPHGWVNVLHLVQSEIIKNIDELDANQVTYINLIIARKIKTDHIEEFYNSVFFDKLIQKIIGDDMGFEMALNAQRWITHIRHLNKELLNYLCAAYFEKTSLMGQEISDRNGKLLVLISGLAMANHKTMIWKEVEEYVTKDKSLLNYNHKTLAILALNMMCLGSYPRHILEKVFNGKFDYSQEKFMHWTFCKIYQKIKSDPYYNGPLPSELQVKLLEELHQKTHRNREQRAFQLLPNLEEGLGGPMYVKTKLSTKNFHLIEHVVVFQKDGTPIPINTSTNVEGISDKLEYIEDLEVPPESNVVAILFMPYFWYFRNSNQLMGLYQTTVETLKKKVSTVIPINENQWKTISEKDRTSFLMNEIKLKLNTQL